MEEVSSVLVAVLSVGGCQLQLTADLMLASQVH